SFSCSSHIVSGFEFRVSDFDSKLETWNSKLLNPFSSPREGISRSPATRRDRQNPWAETVSPLALFPPENRAQLGYPRGSGRRRSETTAVRHYSCNPTRPNPWCSYTSTVP